MKKHAYLIIAHNNWKILEKLLILLDDKRNDIYLHIDRKSDFMDFSNKVHDANLSIYHEIDVRWGDVSQIEVELFLFNAAYCKREYSYYHLISGNDLPIKTQDEIHTFFNRNYPTEFIGFSLGMICDDRINKIHAFPRLQRIKSRWGNKMLSLLRAFGVFLQNKLNYNHYKLNEKLMMGPNWVSITEKAVGLILSKKDLIMKQYRYSSCADEVYKQTIIGNSFLFNNVYDKKDDYNGCMRLIDWSKGNPYIFRSVDFELLMSSERMFARKFDEKIDIYIVEKIFEKLNKKDNSSL